MFNPSNFWGSLHINIQRATIIIYFTVHKTFSIKRRMRKAYIYIRAISEDFFVASVENIGEKY